MSKRPVTLPLAELVEDMAIYPRHAVDDAHVAQLVLALRAGAQLPPIVADAGTKRIVDGWHRARAHRRVLGPTGTVSVELRAYESDADLLQDVVRLNATHGRKLDRIDQVRAVLLLEGAGVSAHAIAAVLHLPEERIQKLRIRVAIAPAGADDTVPGTQQVVLKRPVVHLAGRELTREQVDAHTGAPGTSYLLVVRQIRDALRYGLANRADERLLDALRELHAELARYLAAEEPAAAG